MPGAKTATLTFRMDPDLKEALRLAAERGGSGWVAQRVLHKRLIEAYAFSSQCIEIRRGGAGVLLAWIRNQIGSQCEVQVIYNNKQYVRRIAYVHCA